MPRISRQFVQLTSALLLSAIALSVASLGQQPAPGPAQNQDADFSRLVEEWTTRPEFLSPLVDHLPLDPAGPAPRDVLGYHIGAPGRLSYYAECLNYYRRLETASRRVKVFSIGKTDKGRECVVVAVASEDSIRSLDHIRSALAELADPRKTDEARARDIIARTRPM